MAIEGVMRAGHIQLRVLDLDAAVRHYTEYIGLQEVGREGGKVFFKAWDEFDHHSLVLREAEEPGLDHYAFKVRSEADLDRIEGELAERAIGVKHIPAGEQPGIGRRISFVIQSGHRIELYAYAENTGNGLPLKNPDVWPDGLKGMKPTRLDHALLYGPNIPEVTKLFREVLGFGLAEEVVTEDGTQIAVWLTCANKSHDIAFVAAPETLFHHVAFWLESWEDVKNAADIIAKKKIALDIGPTRHGITRGYTIYFFDPSGNRNEVYSGGYAYFPDRPTIQWDEAELGRAIFYYEGRLNEAFLGVTTSGSDTLVATS
jgi:catechol 2,3-dioxygenase